MSANRQFDNMPPSIAALERDPRGYPIPWFLYRSDHFPLDFRVVDPVKFSTAMRECRCWVCGEPMTGTVAFLGGPLSTAQRLYADPPTHIACAEFSVRACPFIAMPKAQRREAEIATPVVISDGHSTANPGVYGMVFCNIGDYGLVDKGMIRAERTNPYVMWFHEGRDARWIEVKQAIRFAKQSPALKHHPQKRAIRSLLDALPMPMTDRSRSDRPDTARKVR